MKYLILCCSPTNLNGSTKQSQPSKESIGTRVDFGCSIANNPFLFTKTKQPTGRSKHGDLISCFRHIYWQNMFIPPRKDLVSDLALAAI